MKICTFTYSIFLVRWVSEKHTLVRTKKTSLQLFTVYAVPPGGVWDIAKYTIPFTLGKKQSDHQPQLIKILWQTKGLEKVTSRFCKDTNSCEPTWFEQVVIQNDQVEQINNLSILQGGTYGKQVGHSIEFNSLTAIGGPDRQLFFELRARVVSPRIFVYLQSLIARWTRNDFSFASCFSWFLQSSFNWWHE